MGLGGTGLVLLLGVTGAAVISTSAGWPSWVPRFGEHVSKKSDSAPVVVADLGSIDQWPATQCIKPLHATGTEPRRWFLDNECDRPIVVMLAWCDEARSVCTAGAPQAAWRYESDGLIMASALAMPTLRRMPKRGAPIAGTFALDEPQGGVLRIRYLACHLGETAVAALTHESMSDEQFERIVLADECYSRVSKASQVVARSGQPPVVSWQ
jgi:hypothetical protein